MAKLRNPKPTADDYCERCGKPYAETHEIFGGSNRQHSMEDGLQVRLCGGCHRLNPQAPHVSPQHEINVELKQRGQTLYENKMLDNGFNEEQARSSFMQRYGRNYL